MSIRRHFLLALPLSLSVCLFACKSRAFQRVKSDPSAEEQNPAPKQVTGDQFLRFWAQEHEKNVMSKLHNSFYGHNQPQPVMALRFSENFQVMGQENTLPFNLLSQINNQKKATIPVCESLRQSWSSTGNLNEAPVNFRNALPFAEQVPMPNFRCLRLQGHNSFLLYPEDDATKGVVIKVVRPELDKEYPGGVALNSLEKSAKIESIRSNKSMKSDLYEWMHESAALVFSDGRYGKSKAFYGLIFRDVSHVLKSLSAGENVYPGFVLWGYSKEEFNTKFQKIIVEGLQSEQAFLEFLPSGVRWEMKKSGAENDPALWIANEYLAPLAKMVAEQVLKEGLLAGSHMQNFMIRFNRGRFNGFVLRDALDVEVWADAASSQNMSKTFINYVSQAVWPDVTYPETVLHAMSSLFAHDLLSHASTLQATANGQTVNSSDQREVLVAALRTAIQKNNWQNTASFYAKLVELAGKDSVSWALGGRYTNMTTSLRDKDVFDKDSEVDESLLDKPTPGKILRDAFGKLVALKSAKP